jgi:hypothetical protein
MIFRKTSPLSISYFSSAKRENKSLTFIIPRQKLESLGLTFTPDSVSFAKYLYRTDCHSPSIVSSFHNYLQSRATFLYSKSFTPKPPHSFGEHITDHLTRWYFLIPWSSPHKNLDIKNSMRFLVPFGKG